MDILIFLFELKLTCLIKTPLSNNKKSAPSNCYIGSLFISDVNCEYQNLQLNMTINHLSYFLVKYYAMSVILLLLPLLSVHRMYYFLHNGIMVKTVFAHKNKSIMLCCFTPDKRQKDEI